MKKFRGKRRYFRNLKKDSLADSYNLDFGKDGWFDVWHTHLDFCGRGENSLKMRREHITAHMSLYEELLEKLETFEKPFQSWVLIEIEDAGADAVYIHTPNPNEDNFPLKEFETKSVESLPNYLTGLVDFNKFEIGLYCSNEGRGYVIQNRNLRFKRQKSIL